MGSSTVSTSAPLSVRERQSRMQLRQKAWAQSSRPNFLADGSGFDSTCTGTTLLIMLYTIAMAFKWAYVMVNQILHSVSGFTLNEQCESHSIPCSHIMGGLQADNPLGAMCQVYKSRHCTVARNFSGSQRLPHTSSMQMEHSMRRLAAWLETRLCRARHSAACSLRCCASAGCRAKRWQFCTQATHACI